MRSRLAALVTSAVLVAVAASCAVPIADLGGPAAGAIDINESGLVVGGSELPGSMPEHRIEHAYVRRHDDSVLDLPPLPGHESSTATGINDAGVVVGTSWGWAPAGTSLPPELRPRGVMWDASGDVSELGDLDGAATEPIDINAAGIVIGTAGNRAFVFDPLVGQVEALPELPGSRWAYPRTINDQGIAVGYVYLDVEVKPVRWDVSAGTIEDLAPTLDERFFPYGINETGSMVGIVANPAPGDPEAAVVLAGSSEAIRIGAGPWSWAIGINEANTVVATAPGRGQAYRWQPATGLVELAPGTTSYVMAVNEAGSMVGVSDDHAVFFGVPPAP